MKEQEKMEKEAERKRFIDYLGVRPDLKEIAERSGAGYQTLYYITTGRQFVSAVTHRQMANAFTDYDVNWIMFGIRREAKKPAPVASGDHEPHPAYVEPEERETSSVPNQVLLAENAGLKKEIARLEETVSILRSVVSNQFGKDMESKSESVSDPTRGKQLTIGLNWGVKKADSPMIKIPIASVRLMGRTWSNPVRRSPKR